MSISSIAVCPHKNEITDQIGGMKLRAVAVQSLENNLGIVFIAQ